MYLILFLRWSPVYRKVLPRHHDVYCTGAQSHVQKRTHTITRKQMALPLRALGWNSWIPPYHNSGHLNLASGFLLMHDDNNSNKDNNCIYRWQLWIGKLIYIYIYIDYICIYAKYRIAVMLYQSVNESSGFLGLVCSDYNTWTEGVEVITNLCII